MTKFSKKKNNINCPKSVFGLATTRCNKCCYIPWQILNVCLWKRIPYRMYAQLKLMDADHERDGDDLNPTRAQKTTYTVNKLAKEKVACVGLNRSLEQSLEHMGVLYPAER
ncbi:hypothetical protein TNCV_2960041 [Trichonephila clavipes]|nr:hypothetical protein TNCV_2960041 [Trichonephila clavipes]